MLSNFTYPTISLSTARQLLLPATISYTNLNSSIKLILMIIVFVAVAVVYAVGQSDSSRAIDFATLSSKLSLSSHPVLYLKFSQTLGLEPLQLEIAMILRNLLSQLQLLNWSGDDEGNPCLRFFELARNSLAEAD